MYMGELTRQVLVDMVLEGLMFSNINVEPLLQKQGSFPTRFLSEIESDPVVSSIFHCNLICLKQVAEFIAILGRIFTLQECFPRALWT